MELDCADVVHVALESEHALFDFVVPDLDQVVVAARDKHRLRLVEVNAAHGTYQVARRGDEHGRRTLWRHLPLWSSYLSRRHCAL